MNDVQIFNSPMFGDLRVERNEKGELLFCLKDVCDSLGLQVGAVVIRLQSCHISSIKVATEVVSHGKATGKTQEQEMLFITEPDLYRVIFQSRKPTARKFQDWVFDDVLPTLRKEGTYAITKAPQPMNSYEIEDPIERAKRWIEEQQQVKMLEAKAQQQATIINGQQEQIQKDAPKVEYYDQTLSAINCLTPTQIGNDLGISAAALNKKLSELGIIYKQSGQWLFKGKYKDWQLGGSRTFNRILPDGRVVANTNLVWNQRGKRFILALYNNDFNEKAAIAEITGKKALAHESSINFINN